MMNDNEQVDKTEAELAQEFREYLKIIGEEISRPLKEQVDKNSESADRISSAVEKLDEELQNDIRLSVYKILAVLNKQVMSNIDKKLNIISQNLDNKIESYEKKTTQRLLKHRWIETLIIFSMLTLLFLFK